MNATSHVRIRMFKAVTGKCATCALLSALRKEARQNTKRQYINSLFCYHRSAFMGERAAYSSR